jgi:hypothetical protein
MTQKLTQYVCHDGDFLCPFVCIDGLSRCLTGTFDRRATLRCADACYDPVKFRSALNSSAQNATLTPNRLAASMMNFMDSPLPTPTACRLVGHLWERRRVVPGCLQLPIIVGTSAISRLNCARKCLVESQLDDTGRVGVAWLRSFIIPVLLVSPSETCKRERLRTVNKRCWPNKAVLILVACLRNPELELTVL